MPDKSAASDLIYLARTDSGLTQTQLANRAATSQAAISMYEAGTRSPTFETLERIIHAAGLEMRIRLSEIDTHDSSRQRYEKTIDAKVVNRHNSMQRARVARGGR